MTPRKATHVLLEELCKKADGRPMTAREISDYTGLSKTQIQTIEWEALRKINEALDEFEETVLHSDYVL